MFLLLMGSVVGKVSSTLQYLYSTFADVWLLHFKAPDIARNAVVSNVTVFEGSAEREPAHTRRRD